MADSGRLHADARTRVGNTSAAARAEHIRFCALRNKMKSPDTRWFLSVILLACAAGLHAQPTFSGLTMIDPTGSLDSRAYAINASGQVLVDDNAGNLFLWSGGGGTQITSNLGSGPIYSSFGDRKSVV